MEKMEEMRIPTSEFKNRVTKLQGEISERNIDVVFLYANDYFSENLPLQTIFSLKIYQSYKKI